MWCYVTLWLNCGRDGNRKPKPFDFDIQYKSIDKTLQFRFQRLEIFSLLDETDIESSVVFLKSLSLQVHVYVVTFFLIVSSLFQYELELDKTNKTTCASSEDSD